MNWQTGLIVLALSFAGFCALVWSAAKLIVRKNRRTGLPTHKYDERDSIATFKRMNQP